MQSEDKIRLKFSQNLTLQVIRMTAVVLRKLKKSPFKEKICTDIVRIFQIDNLK